VCIIELRSLTRVYTSDMDYQRPGMSMCSTTLPQDWTWNMTDAAIVRRLVDIASAAHVKERNKALLVGRDKRVMSFDYY
jgi:hypothetical protein